MKILLYCRRNLFLVLSFFVIYTVSLSASPNLAPVISYLLSGSSGGGDLPSYMVEEDAEDGTTNGWTVTGGGSVSNTYDTQKHSRVIVLSGNGLDSEYHFGPLSISNRFFVSWRMKYHEDFAFVVKVKSSNASHDPIYISYTADNISRGYEEHDGRKYIHIGLGAYMKNGSWMHVTRNVDADLKRAFPDESVELIYGFYLRGSGRIDDIITSSSGTVTKRYGLEGSHAVSTYVEQAEGNSIVYYPSDISTVHPTPLIFFCPGWNSQNSETYSTLLRFIASHGYSVIYAKDYYGDVSNFIEHFERMLDDNNDVLPYVDTTRIGVIGHSSGGGDTFKILDHFSKKGYGANGRFLMALDPWFASGMNSAAMRHLPANTNLLIQRYSDPERLPQNDQDPRITWSEYALLDSIEIDHKDYQVYAPAGHSYMTGDKPVGQMQGVLQPLDALMDYTFEHSSDAHNVALETGNDHPWDNGYEQYVEPWRYNYRCDSHDNRAEVMEIDYCHQYEGGKVYPADTNFTEKRQESVPKPDYLGSYVDPVFGNRVTRITDRANQEGNAKPYPKTQVWNADQSIIRLGYHLYWADSFTETAYTQNEHIRGSMTEMKWSSYEPNVFYGIDVRPDKFVFVKATLNGDSTVTYTDMPNATFLKSEYDELLLGKYEGNLDFQDNYVVFAGRKKDTNRVTLIVYHLKDNYGNSYNRIESNVTTDMKWYVEDDNGNFTTEGTEANQMFDWASISALGNYVIVNYRSKKGDPDQEYSIEQYDRDLNHIRRLAGHGNHGDLGVDANGKEVYVQFGFGSLNGENNRGIWMYPLDGSPRVRLLPDKYNGGHVSCRNYQRPGWCYLNTRYLWNGSGMREVFALKLDGSGTVERFAQTHNSTDYGWGVQVNVSPDGTQVLFNSDWGDYAGVKETYHVKVGE